MSDRHYVVAGGTRGIGAELASRLSGRGHRVTVLARSIPSEQLAGVDYLQHDFAGDAPMPALPESIHGVAYCPGTINLRSFRSLKRDDFRSDWEVNLLGAVTFLQASLAGLKKASSPEAPSSVVLFSTVAVQQGMPMHASIAAAKGAIEGLGRSLAAEWSPQIRVNLVAPALTQTSLTERFFSTAEKAAAMASKYPLGRAGVPADAASAADWLLSSESSWVTGQRLGVDGGMGDLRP